ncbi:GNAT family N-acetyltransferase [Chachezhania antarctica]|uniref:GNAT family N-acetyltransferase n=1 Tax=Chachezhania antarctica TaxID=2340860 RepID=UPI000EACDE35|nr:GNAT family N-acetyltransferase [Chachezhania antarctica]|tara:strand:+ start:3367 stop:3903 length:537 start_codon:yes stop_codon:yes gene_type:complete
MIHDRIVNQAVIETDRFSLRPLRRSDQGLIELYAGDERVAKMTTSIPHPLPPGTTEAFISRALSEDRVEDVWAIDGTQYHGTEVMGLISLVRMDRNQSEIGYWIAPAFWNTGLASDAVNALVNANPLGDRTYFASVFQDNPASARVLIHAGFEYLGDAETYSLSRGSNVPTWTYSRKL